MKRQREGGRLKLQETLSDEMNDEDLDKLLSDAGIPEDVVNEMSREEKRSNCNDILTSNAELKNQTAFKENTDTEEKGHELTLGKKQETKEKPKTAKRKRKKQLSLHYKEDIQENEENLHPSDVKSDSTPPKDEENDIALVNPNLETTEMQPPARKIKRGKKSCRKVSGSLKYDAEPLTDEDCDANLVLAPNTERSPAWQRSPTELSEQVISESEMSCSPQESVQVALNPPDLSKVKIGIVRFTPDGVMDPSVYTQVIKLMFDIYLRRLRVVTAKCRPKVREKWGDPVCCGLHSKKSLIKDPRQDQENNIEAGERTKHYATRSLYRNNIGTDFEMETEAEADESKDEKWKFRSSRSKKDVESSNRNEEDIDFETQLSSSPVSGSKVMQYDTVSDSSSENREDSDYDPCAKHLKKSKNRPKKQNKKMTSLKLHGQKKTSQKKKQMKELPTWYDEGEVKEDTSSHLLASKEPQVKVTEERDRDDGKWFGLHSKNSLKKDSRHDEESNIETGDRTKRYARRNLHRSGIGTDLEMESEAKKVVNKEEKWNFRSGRKKMDEGPSRTNEEEMDVEIHSPVTRISDSKMKQYNSVSDSSNENRDFDDNPCPKHQKKNKSLPKRLNQATNSLKLGRKNKAASKKEQMNELCTWNDDTVEEDSSSHQSDSKEQQRKRNVASRPSKKSETLNIDHPDDEIEGISSGEDGAKWLSKEVAPKHIKSCQDQDSKASGKKSYNTRCELESRKFGKKRKINADASWMDVESKSNPDMPESEKANPSQVVSPNEEQTSKDSSEVLSGKSSNMIKSSTDESRHDVGGTSKGLPDSPSVELISSPEDTLDPGMVIDAIPDSQSSGFLLDSNGDMYCTQIKKEFRKHLSRSKEDSRMETVAKDITSLSETQVLKTKKGGGKKSKKISKVGKDEICGDGTLSKDSPEMKRKKQTKLDRFADDPLQVSKQDMPLRQEQAKSKEEEISSSGSSNEAVVLENNKEIKHAKGDGEYSTSDTVQSSLPQTSKKKLREDDILTVNERIGSSSRAEEDLQEKAEGATLEDSDDVNEVPSLEKGTCPICGKEFLTRDLEVHASSCSDFAVEQETVALCMICEKEFRLDQLKMHQSSCIGIHGEYEIRRRGKARAEPSLVARLAARRSKRRAIEKKEESLSSSDDYGELYIEPAD